MSASPHPERRALTLVAVAAVLLAGGLADRIHRDQPTALPASAASPTARPVDAGASTWYCPLANAQQGNTNLPADGFVVVQNTRASAADGVITLFPAAGAPVPVPIRVGPRARLVIHEAEFIKSPAVGAVVEMERGGTAVELTATGSLGESTSPSATGAASKWYLTEGSTALNNSMFVGLFNPFPDDAIVDFDFATEQGRTSPGAFQGVVVPARSVLSVNVGDHVRRRDHVAAAITTRRGRIVVGRIQLRTQPRSGLSVGLAAPVLEKSWDFPDGIVSDSIGERFHVYNPSKQEATIEVALTLDQGAAEPFQFKVPAGERYTLDPGTEPRVPKGVGHAATVTSDIPIVAERTLDYASPAPRIGLSIMLGATGADRHWLLPAGGATDALEEWVVVHNPGRRSARVTMTAVTGGHRVPLEGLQSVELPAGQRRAFRLLDFVAPRPDLPLAIDATRPLVVERVLARVGESGVSQTIAIRIAD